MNSYLHCLIELCLHFKIWPKQTNKKLLKCITIHTLNVKLLKQYFLKYSSLLIKIICRKALFKLCENCIRYHGIVLP